jgi:hypothetical protein
VVVEVALEDLGTPAPELPGLPPEVKPKPKPKRKRATRKAK